MQRILSRPPNAHEGDGRAEIRNRIAELLNENNYLTAQYRGEDINLETVITKIEGGVLQGAIEVQNVSWYQCEIRHLVVAPEFRRRGIGRSLLHAAEREVLVRDRFLAQATIRSTNRASKFLFNEAGWTRTSRIQRIGYKLDVMQKVIV